MKVTKICLMLFTIIALCAGCSRPPKNVKSCTIQMSSEIKDNKELYNALLKLEVENQSTDTIFRDIKGNIIISDKGSDAVTIPFTVNTLLPFNENIIVMHQFTEESVKQLMPKLGLTIEHLHTNKRLDEQSISDEKVAIKIESYKTENIIDALRGKVK